VPGRCAQGRAFRRRDHCTALNAALAGIPVHHDGSVTGEMALAAGVLPIGAQRNWRLPRQVKTVVIPDGNFASGEEVDRSGQRKPSTLSPPKSDNSAGYALTRSLAANPAEKIAASLTKESGWNTKRDAVESLQSNVD